MTEGDKVAAHPNAMSEWAEIRCQRGHTHHPERVVSVDLGGPTPYHDYTPIPERLAVGWDMRIWDQTPDTDARYCPANDAVSDTIASLGVWEPRETVLALTVLSSVDDPLVVDFGSQVGWFSLLALACGAHVVAYEADADNADLLEASVRWTGNNPDWSPRFDLRRQRVGPTSTALPPVAVRWAKADVEGAEGDAVRVLWPSIEAGLVDHLMVEVSPCFAGYYGRLVAELMDAGYEAFVLPPKRIPPVDLADPAAALGRYRLERDGVEATVGGWRQEDCWFKRIGASW